LQSAVASLEGPTAHQHFTVLLGKEVAILEQQDLMLISLEVGSRY
jgi:hypothetical protein